MRKIALALTLVLASGYITNTVYAATSTNYTVVQTGDKDKKKSKKSCSTETAKKSCSTSTSQKACCSSEKK